MTSEKAYEDAYCALLSKQAQLDDLAAYLLRELRRIADLDGPPFDFPRPYAASNENGVRSGAALASPGLANDLLIANLRRQLAESEARLFDVTAKITTLEKDLDLRGAENRSIESSRHEMEFAFADTAAQLAAARREIERRDLVLGAMRRRLSWRLGAPLRVMRRIYTRIREMYHRPAPNPLFDEAFYLEQYPDVREIGMNPYRHYIRFGAFQSRNPNPMFDSKWYLEQNADVRGRSMNPLIHFYGHGAAEGRDPHPLFSTKWYLAQLSKSETEGVNPLEHYLRAIKRPSDALGAS